MLSIDKFGGGVQQDRRERRRSTRGVSHFGGENKVVLSYHVVLTGRQLKDGECVTCAPHCWG